MNAPIASNPATNGSLAANPNTNGSIPAGGAGAGGGKLSVLNTVTPFGLPQGQFLALQAAAQAWHQATKLPGILHLEKSINPAGGPPPGDFGETFFKLTYNGNPGGEGQSGGMSPLNMPPQGGGRGGPGGPGGQ